MVGTYFILDQIADLWNEFSFNARGGLSMVGTPCITERA